MAQDLGEALLKLDKDLREGLAALDPAPHSVVVLFSAYETELQKLRPVLASANEAAAKAASDETESARKLAAKEMGAVNERVSLIGELVQAIGREVKHHVHTRAKDPSPRRA